MPAFGRLVHYDARSVSFPIRPLLPSKPLKTRTWKVLQLDQGTVPACVGFSCTMMASSTPDPFFGTTKNLDPAPINLLALDVYKRAQVLDDMPGEAYEGSSVLGGIKVGIERGWWTEYRWALGPGPELAAADAMRAVSLVGPVVMGANWWDGMYQADENKYLNPTGLRVGGHAFILSAYNSVRDACWVPNSWKGAGQGWLSRASIISLLADQGEVAVPIHRYNTHRNKPPAAIGLRRVA